jgi:arginyl-tRNA synthetase
LNYFGFFRGQIIEILDALVAAGGLPAGLDFGRVTVEPPRERGRGDLATNAAMVLAKPAGRKPRDLAEVLAEGLRALDDVTSCEVAGPGFINVRVKTDVWYERLREILAAGRDYGSCDMGAGAAVNVEYVSANPTGPLTIAHARGAVVGDVLAALLEKVGYRVTREYYINDAGTQVDTLANSAYLRYREALGEEIGDIPEGLYPGDYLKAVGQALAARDGTDWLDKDEAQWLPAVRRFATEALMARVRDDLAALGVRQEVFSSERRLVEAGGVDAVLETLEKRGLVYRGVLAPPKGKKSEDWEPRPQLLFRAMDFGDDVDRPLKKPDGSWTYFANDMAYHLDKFRRGFPTMIDVWGADHSGYIKRMQAGVTALTEAKGQLEVRICQMVTLMRGGTPVKMSKCSGSFIALSEVIEEVGKDVVRFIMLTRKNDAPLEFDLEKVVEQSRDNPVFYVHYAHARCCSVLRHAAAEFPQLDQTPEGLKASSLSLLTDSNEVDLLRLMAEWPRLLEGAAEAREPHRVAFYLSDVAAAMHGLWTMGKEDTRMRFLLPEDLELTQARLALLQAVAFVIASGLHVFGVEPLEELR